MKIILAITIAWRRYIKQFTALLNSSRPFIRCDKSCRCRTIKSFYFFCFGLSPRASVRVRVRATPPVHFEIINLWVDRRVIKLAWSRANKQQCNMFLSSACFHVAVECTQWLFIKLVSLTLPMTNDIIRKKWNIGMMFQGEVCFIATWFILTVC